MAESVEGCRFVEPRSLYGCTYGELHEAFIKMVPSFDVLVRIPPVSVIGKQPLPSPFPSAIPVFPFMGTASNCPKLSLPPFLEVDAGTLHWNPLALAPGLSGPSLTLCFVQPLPVSLPDLLTPQPVSALSQPSASTTNNPTSRQNRSIRDSADSSRYPAKNPVTVDRGSPTNRSSANAGSSQPQSRAG